MIGLQSGEEKIGERIGWSREKVKDHVTLRSKIGAEILFLAKTFQAGRAPSNGANAPKNERRVTPGLGSVVLPFFQLCQFLTNPKRKHPLFARQAAYTPPREEIVPYHVYSPSRGKTNAHKGDKRVVFQNPRCGLMIDDSLFFLDPKR